MHWFSTVLLVLPLSFATAAQEGKPLSVQTVSTKSNTYVYIYSQEELFRAQAITYQDSFWLYQVKPPQTAPDTHVYVASFPLIDETTAFSVFAKNANDEVINAFVTLTASEGVKASIEQTVLGADSFEMRLLAAINDRRHEEGLLPLVWDAKMAALARLNNQKGGLSHAVRLGIFQLAGAGGSYRSPEELLKFILSNMRLVKEKFTRLGFNYSKGVWTIGVR